MEKPVLDQSLLEANAAESQSAPTGRVPLSEACEAYISFILKNSSFPYERSIDIAFHMGEVQDDTGPLRYSLLQVDSIDFVLFLTRKTWNFVVVKVFQYPEADRGYALALGGLHKFLKTLLSLGTDRLFNSALCAFDRLSPIVTRSGRSVSPYATSLRRTGSLLFLAFSIVVPLYLDPVDIHDATWKEFIELRRTKEDADRSCNSLPPGAVADTDVNAESLEAGAPGPAAEGVQEDPATLTAY